MFARLVLLGLYEVGVTDTCAVGLLRGRCGQGSDEAVSMGRHGVAWCVCRGEMMRVERGWSDQESTLAAADQAYIHSCSSCYTINPSTDLQPDNKHWGI